MVAKLGQALIIRLVERSFRGHRAKTNSRAGSLRSSTSTTAIRCCRRSRRKSPRVCSARKSLCSTPTAPPSPNEAVQEQQTFINQDKIMLMTGSTSSAVAVALNKFAQREKVLYVTGISGSNDTTGKDCVRYGFRQNFYGQTAAAAIGPVLVKNFGKNKKAAFMTPDYTYGHTVTKSVNDYLTTNAGWTMVTNQVSPLGTSDFSQYLTNVANSGAEFLINVNWGRDAVLSTQQAHQFGLLPKMTLVIPYQIPFLAKEVGPEIMGGVFAATDFWWTLEDKYPLAKMFVEAFDKKYGYKPEWGAENAYMQLAIWARMVEDAGNFYPPDVIRTYEKGQTFPSMVGDVHFRPEDHQLVRPVIIVRGKYPKDMKNKEDYWEVLEVVPGGGLMQQPNAFGRHLGDYPWAISSRRRRPARPAAPGLFAVCRRALCFSA